MLNNKNSNEGLTLIELLVCLLLITILLGLCLPFSLSILRTNQLQVMENEISGAIHYARNKAFTEKRSLVLAPLSNSDWSSGMILFTDNKKHQYSLDKELLHQWQWPSGVKITWHGFYSNDYLLFSANLQHAAVSGHFDIDFEDKKLKLIVNRLGRTRKAELSEVK